MTGNQTVTVMAGTRDANASVTGLRHEFPCIGQAPDLQMISVLPIGDSRAAARRAQGDRGGEGRAVWEKAAEYVAGLAKTGRYLRDMY